MHGNGADGIVEQGSWPFSPFGHGSLPMLCWGRAHTIARQIRTVSTGNLHTLWDARKRIFFSNQVFTCGAQKPRSGSASEPGHISSNVLQLASPLVTDV
jgi:hypothetical protein